MELRHLRYFVTVAETLSYTRAAKQLHMAVSPLSRAIKEMEIEVGGALFDRGTRHVRLTEAGRSLLPEAEDVLAGVSAMIRSTKTLVDPQTHVTVGLRAVSSGTRRLIGRAIRNARSEAEIDWVSKRPAEQQLLLVRGDLDFATLADLPHDHRIETLHILDEQLGLALPAQPPFLDAKEVTAADVANFTFIVHHEVADQHMADILATVRNFTTVDWDIPGSAQTLVAEGRHVTLTAVSPDSPAHMAIASEQMIVLPLSPIRYYPTHLAWLARRNNPRDLGPIINQFTTVFASPLRS